MVLLAAFAEQERFTVETEPAVVRAAGVPCLLANRTVGTCTIEKSCDPSSGTPNERLGGARHAVHITIDSEGDGRVYHADGQPIGSLVGSDGRTWSDISIRRGSQQSPEDDATPSEIVHRYAKQIVGAVSAMGYNAPEFISAPSPFKVPDTHEERSGIGSVQDRIRGTRICIVGLGGTGSYVLDLIAKTPVAEIHLIDSDCHEWHNYMRAPGAPTAEEIESQHSEAPAKVDYYRSKYRHFRGGIHVHPVKAESQSDFAGLLSAHRFDFAFVCIDQRPDGDSPRQDYVYAALSQAEVPFVDSGISITIDDEVVRGAVTTSAYATGSLEWQDAIPNARIEGEYVGYRNIQLPEVNALAASFAVMEWRRRTEQYASGENPFFRKFLLESAQEVTAD